MDDNQATYISLFVTPEERKRNRKILLKIFLLVVSAAVLLTVLIYVCIDFVYPFLHTALFPFAGNPLVGKWEWVGSSHTTVSGAEFVANNIDRYGKSSYYEFFSSGRGVFHGLTGGFSFTWEIENSQLFMTNRETMVVDIVDYEVSSSKLIIDMGVDNRGNSYIWTHKRIK